MNKLYKKLVQLSTEMYNNLDILRKNLKQFRNELHLTQEELANKIGGKKSLISNYENGHSVPDIIILCQLADIFEVSLDELVGREFIKYEF